LILGILIGAALVVGLVLWIMRTRMIATHRSERSFADTCAAIEQVVPDAPGWGFPLATWDFSRTFEQKNLVPRSFRQLRQVAAAEDAFPPQSSPRRRARRTPRITARLRHGRCGRRAEAGAPDAGRPAARMRAGRLDAPRPRSQDGRVPSGRLPPCSASPSRSCWPPAWA
jgi:hypothetical protein